ncbi:MAG TPA: hypothetical protein VJ436_14400 [Anaerolineales bacterium]|nr:hypothetical protein [Anaerolineales bacterium]
MMQKKYKKTRKPKQNKALLPILLGLGGVLLIAAAFLVTRRGEPKEKAPIEVSGNPSLKVDRDKVDFGDVKLGVPINVSFELTNVGDKTLRLSEKPYIEVLEGC